MKKSVIVFAIMALGVVSCKREYTCTSTATLTNLAKEDLENGATGKRKNVEEYFSKKWGIPVTCTKK